MVLCLIVAMDERGVIGAAGGLPWRLAADLRRFKSLTMGHPIIMGRKTHDSIGRVLPGRVNVVISSGPARTASGLLWAASLQHALSAVSDHDRAFVIGGASVYAAALPQADRIYLTEVHTRIAGGDTYFPHWRRTHWRELTRQRFAADADNDHDHSFVVLERAGTTAED